MTLRIKNWDNFQHYKDRNPSWIKLHFSILSSHDWVVLDDASRVLAVACMLIASRNHGEIPDDPDYIKRVAYLNKRPNFKPLIDCGFLESASDCTKMLANALQSRGEVEESRGETDSKGASAPSGVNGFPKLKADQVIELYRKHFPDASDVAQWTPARAQAFSARLKDLQTLDEWDTYFQRISKSKFLMGRVDGRNGQPPFKLSMDFVLRQSTLTKVFEGYYER